MCRFLRDLEVPIIFIANFMTYVFKLKGNTNRLVVINKIWFPLIFIAKYL